jgi:hypothetical protein
LGWNVQVDRWDFVLGYPAMVAISPLHRKSPSEASAVSLT